MEYIWAVLPLFREQEGKLYSMIWTAAVCGLESVCVRVEADVSEGLPVFDMVGVLAAEVKEAKERVRTALKNCGHRLPAKRITINLSPANLRKSGSGFDLPIAIAILVALGEIPPEAVRDTMIMGEVGLNGQILPMHGVLAMVADARACGITKCIVPWQNGKEAAVIPGLTICPVRELSELVEALQTGKIMREAQLAGTGDTDIVSQEKQPDFAEIHGQKALKRVCEVAVAGMHNLLMIGPPGSGKTMIAGRIPGILPPMGEQEQLDVTKIYSICGMLPQHSGLVQNRPFRNPHHTITPKGMSGGGAVPKPGEISLAHHGVLFLDELAEFKRETLETLRQPMEDKTITLVRQSGTYTYPADFMLIAAMNPCKCGYYPDRTRCSCSPWEIRQYLGTVSRPLLDRLDICAEAPQLAYEELTGTEPEESSEVIRGRVLEAVERQKFRFRDTKITSNSKISSAETEHYCSLARTQWLFMKKLYDKAGMSARGYYKILKTARTIADLDGSEEILQRHLSEAVCYRMLDQKYWE